MKRGFALASGKSPTSPAAGLRRLPHRRYCTPSGGPEESDVLVHGSRRRRDRMNSITSETMAHVVIGRARQCGPGDADCVRPHMALFGPRAMPDLTPECAPKRTLAHATRASFN